jgi:predicted dehydrogenase
MNKQSRRHFIQTTAALTAAPFISTRVTQALARDSKKLGWAICGLGNLSTNQIAPALQKTENCRLTGIITDTPEKAKKWQAMYNIPAKNVYTYDTMEKMVGNKDIDVVYIVTPNALHLEQTQRAAKAGKHVYCEKPMETSVERCQQMIDACKQAGRKLGIAYRCQFEPHNLECIRIARDKELGAVKIVEATFGFAIGDPSQWRLKHALSGGGALMDVGVYCVQASRYITGEEPMMVSATETKTDPEKFKEVDETIAWTEKFPSGAIATCSSTFGAATPGRYLVQAQRGWFGLEPAFNYGGIKGRRSDGKDIAFPQIDHFAAEMDDFSRCILENQQSRVAGEEGLRDVKIMMAIYESARTGKPVNLA